MADCVKRTTKRWETILRMPIKMADSQREVSRILLDIGAVECRVEPPFRFTSGWKSPVYVDCRLLMSTPLERRRVVSLAASHIERHIGARTIDVIAGGETAGIPFAAWIAEHFFLPMIYVRKEPKGFGRLAQIEGRLRPGQRVLLIEDLATDGKSKARFANALREAGAVIDSAFVIFHYAVYPDTENNLAAGGLTLHALTDWPTTVDVVEASGTLTASDVATIREFLKEPHTWSRQRGGA